MLYHHSEKARGSHVYIYMCVCVCERDKELHEEGRGKYEGCRGAAVGIRPQNMVVSYLVLTGRLLESRWSKSQVVLPRDCMSGSISRGSICRGREGGGTRGGRETGGSGGHCAIVTSPQLTHVHVD